MQRVVSLFSFHGYLELRPLDLPPLPPSFRVLDCSTTTTPLSGHRILRMAPPLPQRSNTVRPSASNGLKATELIDLTAEERELEANPNIPPGAVCLHSIVLGKNTLTSGTNVELIDGDFFRIIHIFREIATAKVGLRGYLLRRTSAAENFFPTDSRPEGKVWRWVNELCLIAPSLENLENGNLAECMITRDPGDVLRTREIFFTNAPFPEFSHWRETRHDFHTVGEAKAVAELTCRWKIAFTKNSGGSYFSGAVVRLREEDCDEKCRCSDVVLLKSHKVTLQKGTKAEAPKTEKARPQQSRTAQSAKSKKRRRIGDQVGHSDDEIEIIGYKVRKTSKVASSNKEYTQRQRKRSITTVSVMESIRSMSIASIFPARKSRRGPTAQPQAQPQRPKVPPEIIDLNEEQYTLGELCAGIGGFTSGAQQGGIRAIWLLDKCPECCEGLRKNFPPAEILCEELQKFCDEQTARGFDVECDVLHISFPCQTHSLAHTVEGKNDDANSAAMFGVLEKVIDKCKPRIITLEQSPGIVERQTVTDERYGTIEKSAYFKYLVRELTEKGYSVRWRKIDASKYGVAQLRQRMIMIASCPGEILPQFPEPTHGDEPGLKPIVSIRDILNLAEQWKRFVPDIMNKSKPCTGKPQTPMDIPLPHCITTSGTEDIHPSGERTYTPLELALFQGFLPHHTFVGGFGDIKKQIGNAVPAVFAKLLSEQLVSSLRESDRRIKKWDLQQRRNAIELEED